MVEQVFTYSIKDDKVIERIVMDDNLNYIHMVFNKGEGAPEHYSNSNVYMNVVRGTLSLKLNEQEVHEYKKGNLLKIPYNTKMSIKNLHDSVLELIVVKAPAPANYKSTE